MRDDAASPGAELCDGRYRLERIIGSGGMAIVWRASDRRLGRNVAIKVIADTLAADPAYVARFEREARTAAGLSHPNLVQVYDYAAGESRPFLIMALVEGGTLADRIARGPVDRDEAHALTADLLSALACVHDAGILHRDIKPANVLIGSDGRARLTDFGIAHPEDATRLTQTGHLVGTIRYLAPEVIEGEPASAERDLYALGVLVADLTGEDADPPMRAFVERLTAPEPGDRPGSAQEALRLLHAATPTTKTVPRRILPRAPAPSSLPAQSGGAAWRARHGRIPANAAIATAAVLLVVVALVLALGQGGGANRAADDRDAGSAASTSITLEQRLDQLDALISGARR